MDDQPFGEMLREYRRRRKMTLRETAGLLGISVPYLSDVENGRRNPFRGELLQECAKVFEVEPGLLLSSSAESMGEVKIPLPSAKTSEEKRALIKIFAGRVESLSETEVGDLNRVLKGAAIVFPIETAHPRREQFLRKLWREFSRMDSAQFQDMQELLDENVVVIPLATEDRSAGQLIIKKLLELDKPLFGEQLASVEKFVDSLG